MTAPAPGPDPVTLTAWQVAGATVGPFPNNLDQIPAARGELHVARHLWLTAIQQWAEEVEVAIRRQNIDSQETGQ